jgi:hypothetical protein
MVIVLKKHSYQGLLSLENEHFVALKLALTVLNVDSWSEEVQVTLIGGRGEHRPDDEADSLGVVT